MGEQYRKSVFIVVYAKENNQIKYLVLQRKLHWKGWEFPKEGIEKSETEEDAVRRGTREETGLNIKGKIKKLNMYGEYKYKKRYNDRPNFIGQSFSLYAVEVVHGKVKLDVHEHSNYDWLDFDNAMKRLTWKNQQRCLESVNSSLENKNFRRHVTKNGILLLAGKDENSNEDLVKQSKPEEYVLHTAAAGSPFVNVNGDASREDIKEAAIFCAKFSRDWKQHKKDIEVNLFRKRDMYKLKGMKAGTFGVKKLEKIFAKKQDIEKFNAPAGN
jgi:bis(5'-nucleosidyl)-tetraphosphatase